MVPPRHIHIHAVPKRPAALLGTADGWKDPVAVPGWDSGGLEHLHGVFPSAFIGRIFLRTPALPVPQQNAIQNSLHPFGGWIHPPGGPALSS